MAKGIKCWYVSKETAMDVVEFLGQKDVDLSMFEGEERFIMGYAIEDMFVFFAHEGAEEGQGLIVEDKTPEDLVATIKRMMP